MPRNFTRTVDEQLNAASESLERLSMLSLKVRNAAGILGPEGCDRRRAQTGWQWELDKDEYYMLLGMIESTIESEKRCLQGIAETVKTRVLEIVGKTLMNGGK